MREHWAADAVAAHVRPTAMSSPSTQEGRGFMPSMEASDRAERDEGEVF